MQFILVVAGKSRPGPERELCERFLDRIKRIGTNVGFGNVVLKEYDPVARPLPRWLDRSLAKNQTALCVMDKRGETQRSKDFAKMLAEWRDDGWREIIFLIGGPDGVDQALKDRADRLVSFGQMTYPHMIARIMLAEQLFRAVSILRGDPYHRE